MRLSCLFCKNRATRSKSSASARSIAFSSTHFGVDNVASLGGKLPGFDVHIPLLSVPGVLGTMPDSVPGEVPYLTASPDIVEHWRQELNSLKGLRVGIAWQGNPTIGDQFRCVQLAQYASLARIPRVHLISLQKAQARSNCRRWLANSAFSDFGERLDSDSGPFRDSAAIMKNLDLVVSSDTAVCHLAGALGVPVWVAAAPLSLDWRLVPEIAMIVLGIRQCDFFGSDVQVTGTKCLNALPRNCEHFKADSCHTERLR